jgi:hypothetical protein
VSSGQVILVGSDFLGRGDQRLGTTLAREFFRALARREEDLPSAIVFINAGVRLLIEGSAILASLQELDSRDVSIVADRTSAQHFDLEDKLEVGDTLPMAEILELLLGAPVISL